MYSQTVSDDSLMGAIFANIDDTIETTLQLIREVKMGIKPRKKKRVFCSKWAMGDKTDNHTFFILNALSIHRKSMTCLRCLGWAGSMGPRPFLSTPSSTLERLETYSGEMRMPSLLSGNKKE